MERLAALRPRFRGTLALPDQAIRRILGPAPRSDRGIELDMRTHALLQLASRVGLGNWHRLEVESARRKQARNAVLVDLPRRPVHAVRELAVPSPSGPVRVRVYRPDAAQRRPILVFLHGGGFVLGSLDTHDSMCRLFAVEARCVVASVDYRLAPEHPFPAGLDDALAAFCWLREHAEALGGRSDRMAIAGDSAGANLATLVCHRLRDAGLPQPMLQALLYPTTDVERSQPSHRVFADGFYLTQTKLDWFLDCYLGHLSSRERERASPLHQPNYAGLAPALIVTAGFDPLRDDGTVYAARLAAAGGRVEHHCRERLIHGFLNMGGVIPAARRATLDIADRLRAVLHRPQSIA